MIRVYESNIVLNRDQLDIIKKYTINTSLDKDEIKILNDTIIDYGGLDNEVTLYRVVSPKELGYETATEMLKNYDNLEGSIITPRQFVSTTAKQDYGGFIGQRLIFKNNKGKMGIPIYKYSAKPGEKEYLFKYKNKYKIIEVVPYFDEEDEDRDYPYSIEVYAEFLE